VSLNGPLRIEKLDNGWMLEWYEAQCIERHREVFSGADECMARIAELVGMERAE
jgi:hypothetical protein